MSAFDRIIGYASVKKELEQISDTLKNREAYSRLGVSAPKGLLLYGEPGVGKSLMAEALIEESDCRCFLCRKDLSGSDFVKKIKDTFEQAVQNAPSIVYLDDLDKFANTDELHQNAEEYIVVQSCIDAIKDKPVFVLATVNVIQSLPRSLRRAGRFDRRMKIEVPSGSDARKIIENYLNSKKSVSGIDPDIAAELMSGHSCAELESMINEAGLYAGYERAKSITMKHFIRAYLKTVLEFPIELQKEKKDRLSELHRDNPEFERIIYHEAAHTVMSEILRPGSTILACVYDRGAEQGGFVRVQRFHAVQPDVLACEAIVSLGGRAVTEQKYGTVDAGSAQDLEKAFRTVRVLLTKHCLNGFSMYAGEEPSQRTLFIQEQLVAAEVERCYKKAKEILVQNLNFLEKMASALADRGLLLAPDIQEVRNNSHIVPYTLKDLL